MASESAVALAQKHVQSSREPGDQAAKLTLSNYHSLNFHEMASTWLGAFVK